MKMQMHSCIIKSEDGNSYIVRRSDLFLFIWRVGFKRHFRTLRATHLDRETALYASPKVQLIINLCTIIESTFIFGAAFPSIMVLMSSLPSEQVSLLLVDALVICGVFLGYVIKTLIASFLVPHVRWLTLKPDMDSVDFQFKIEQGKNAGMWIVYPILIIEIISFFAIFF